MKRFNEQPNVVGELIKKARKEFIEFTKKIWIQEITEDKTGSLFNNKIREVLETKQLYDQVKNEYDVLYKESNFEKENKFNFGKNTL